MKEADYKIKFHSYFTINMNERLRDRIYFIYRQKIFVDVFQIIIRNTLDLYLK